MQKELEALLAKHQEQIIAAVSSTIVTTVNGKINRLDEKISGHIVSFDTYVKEDIKWKALADPYIKLAANISGVWKFVIYVGGGVLVLLGLYTAIDKLAPHVQQIQKP